MEQRNVNSQHKHNEQTQAYLEQIRGKKQDEGERSEEMDRRRELVRKHTLFSAHLDRALKFKMIEENQPFWMPPIVRSRDFDKFVACTSGVGLVAVLDNDFSTRVKWQPSAFVPFNFEQN